MVTNGVKLILTKGLRHKWVDNANFENKNGLINIGLKWKNIELMSTKSTYLEFLKPLITKPTSIENLEKT